jgi:hypothetical protein
MNDLSKHLRDFLETQPLYKWSKIQLPERLSQFTNLSQIEMECLTCRVSRPFSDRRSRGAGIASPGSTVRIPEVESGIYLFLFTCNGCLKGQYYFYVELDVENKRIRKVGQSPPWSIT